MDNTTCHIGARFRKVTFSRVRGFLSFSTLFAHPKDKPFEWETSC